MADKQLNRIRQLLLPSLLSGLVTIFLSLAIIAAAIFSFLSGGGTIYDYLFGPNSSAELIRSASGSIEAFKNTVFGNPTLNKILFFCFWMLVGLVVYIILYLIFKGTSEAAEEIQETTYVNRRSDDLLRTLGTRLAIRVGAVVLWIIYIVFFVKTLVPFSILCARLGAGDFPELTGWLYVLLGISVLTLSVHAHVVFLRVITLKVRLIDSGESSS